MVRRWACAAVVVAVAAGWAVGPAEAAGLAGGAEGAAKERRLPVKEYVSRMKAGWVGQMAGVGVGGPTEFKSKGAILPADRVPKWQPGMINQFNQDDIYVEMTFLRTLEQHGLNASIRQAGIDFANSGYPLWHANAAGRDNLRKGIAPPDSGHPQFNKHADDIDYQIESDYSGLIAPGMPNAVIRLGEVFGRLMNYGDGLYGGQFVGGMYAEAFFEADPVKIVEAGLRCIPAGSQYHECISDVLKWHKDNPDDWQKTWQLIDDKYQKNPAYRRASCNKGDYNIDAKINGAYIIMGLLYGKGDPELSIAISCRCGQDSDCNPSSTGGILFTTIGSEKLPGKFTSALNPEGKFSHTPYNFPMLIEVCEKLARQAVVAEGGRIEKDAAGEEVFIIPVKAPQPTRLEQCWEPGPPAGSTFTDEEKAKIQLPARTGREAGGGRSAPKVDIAQAVEKFAPGWTVANCGGDMDPGLLADWSGRKNVLVTHPLSEKTPCTLSRKLDVPAGKKSTLRLEVASDDRGDWELAVKADGRELHKQLIAKSTAKDGWLTVAVDLSALAGKTVTLELENRANGWSWEAGLWAKIAVDSE